MFNKNQYREPIFSFISCETYRKDNVLTRYCASVKSVPNYEVAVVVIFRWWQTVCSWGSLLPPNALLCRLLVLDWTQLICSSLTSYCLPAELLLMILQVLLALSHLTIKCIHLNYLCQCPSECILPCSGNSQYDYWLYGWWKISSYRIVLNLVPLPLL